MRVSITITEYNWPGGSERLAGQLREIVTLADDGGINTVWVADHLLQRAPGTAITDPHLEAYATLGFLAGVTRRVRLGTLVSAATFRPAALMIKAVTTLDVLSGGRAWLGIGADYDEGEAAALDLPLPPTAERFERLEEILRLAEQLWAGDTAPFEGRQLRLAQPISSPAPIQRPHPPVLIGGTGERRTLRLVAEHADACNLFDIPDGGRTLRRKLDVLARHCDDVGRPFDAIEKTLSTRVVAGEPVDAVVERFRDLSGHGIDHVIALTTGAWTEPVLATVAAAAAELR